MALNEYNMPVCRICNGKRITITAADNAGFDFDETGVIIDDCECVKKTQNDFRKLQNKKFEYGLRKMVINYKENGL